LSNTDPRIQKFINSIASDSSFSDALKNIAAKSIADTGDCSFAFFTTAMVEFMRENIKQEFRNVRSSSKPKIDEDSASPRVKHDGSWRGIVENHFSGHGKVWCFVSLDTVSQNITAMRNAGIDCDNYESLINSHGKAWLRFMGTRMHPDSNTPCALFWIWPAGSKGVVGKMHESAWVYIPANDATNEDKVQFIGTTPYKAGLEDVKPKNFGKQNQTQIQTNNSTQDNISHNSTINVSCTQTQEDQNHITTHNQSIADELDDLENELFND